MSYFLIKFNSQDDENFENQVAIYQDLQTPNQIRLGGQVARDNLRDDMPDQS